MCPSVPVSAGQFLLQDFVELGGVGFALAGFHCKADEEAEDLFLAAAVFGDLCRVGGNDFIHDLLDRAAVGYLL